MPLNSYALRLSGLLMAGSVATVALRSQAADEKWICAAAYDKAQDLRSEGKLRAAREQLLICGRDTCPAVLRGDCAPWLAEVESNMPSVVIEGRDAKGKETATMRVLLDGQLLAEHLDGKAISIDPGVHIFRYEMPGVPAVEDQVVIRQGEKNRRLQASFVALSASSMSAVSKGATAPEASTERAPSAAETPPPVVAYVLGGVGVAALGGFTYFALAGKSEEADKRSGPNACAPHCTDSDLDSIHKKYLIADLSLGVGVVSLGVATYLYLSHLSTASVDGRASARVDVHPLPHGGGVAVISGQF